MREQHDGYDRTPGGTRHQGHQSEPWAEVEDAATLRAELARRQRLIENLQAALSSRTTIGRALGVLEERYSLDEHTAFALLTRISNQHNVKVRVVAAEFLATRQLPASPAEDPGPYDAPPAAP